MSIIIDATVAGPSANSYATVAETSAFAEASPYASEWTAAVDADGGEALLVRAMRVLQALAYDGQQYLSTQALPFPRCGLIDPSGTAYSTAVIPTCVKEAQMTLAVWLSAQTGDQFGQDAAASLQSLTAGPVNLQFRSQTRTAGEDYLTRTIVPILVAGCVMAPMNSVRLMR